MDELIEWRGKLAQLKLLVNGLNIFKNSLPPFVLMTDLYSLLEELNYLSGYIDCMIKFKNELVES